MDMQKTENQHHHAQQSGRLIGLSSYGLAFVLSMVHVVGLTVVFMMAYWTVHFRGGVRLEAHTPQQSGLLFNLHPLLMVVGMVVLPAEGILIYKSIPGSKPLRKVAHLATHMVGLLLSAIGLYAVFRYHANLDIQDMYSLHSWLGITTITLFSSQWMVALASFFCPGLVPHLRAKILPWHVLMGVFILGLAIATSEVGLLEKLTFLQMTGSVPRRGPEAALVNTTGLALLLLGFLVLVAVAAPNLRHPPN